jgi:hypothetical protein
MPSACKPGRAARGALRRPGPRPPGARARSATPATRHRGRGDEAWAEHDTGPVDTSGSIDDWRDEYAPGAGTTRAGATPPEGAHSEVAVGWDETCALDAEGTPTCWGFDWPDAAPPTGTSLRSLSCGNGYHGALGADGRPYARSAYPPEFTSHPDGPFAISVSSFNAVVSSDGSTLTFGTDHDQLDDDEPAAPVVSVCCSQQGCCGLTDQRLTTCWGREDPTATSTSRVRTWRDAGALARTRLRATGLERVSALRTRSVRSVGGAPSRAQ